MTITDLVRNREGVSPRLRPNPLKLPQINKFSFASKQPVKRHHSKVSSDSNGSNLRHKLQKGVSNIRTFFRSRNQESDPNDTEHLTTQTVTVSQDGSSHSSSKPLTGSTNPLRLKLTGASLNDADSAVPTSSCKHESVPCNTPVSHRSIASLRRRVSTRLLSSLTSSPTVIIKPELRSRPSVQTICYERASMSDNSATTQSTSSTTKKGDSTPPTSEGTTPGSVYHQDIDPCTTSDQLLVLFDYHNLPRKLSTIHEIDGRQIATIKTVEATAAAK